MAESFLRLKPLKHRLFLLGLVIDLVLAAPDLAQRLAWISTDNHSVKQGWFEGG
jgi:hypothetical protein